MISNYIQLMQQGCTPGKSMCNKGGGGSSTTIQEIPAELKGLATAYSNKAMALGNKKFQSYSGDRYADLNDTQNQALEMIQNRATNGSRLINSAQRNLNQMMKGGSNPYLDASVKKALGAVKGQVNSQFGGGSNYGSTANQELMTRNMGDVATQMYGQAYDNDQNRRLSAINQAQSLGNQAYTDASQLLNAGQIMQDQSQQGLDFNYQQFQDKQNLPYKKLAAMSGVFGSNLGGSSSTTSSGGGK